MLRLAVLMIRFWLVTAMAVLIAAKCTLAADSFTFIALPDTQSYVNNATTAAVFTQQTQWVADQIQIQGNPRNIQFVSHLGDVVGDARNPIEWQRADASMDILDGVVKYSVLPGNHDYSMGSTKSSGTEHYLEHFGPARFTSYSWYGGSDPSGNNSYQFFSAGGYDFLHLALEWDPSQNVPLRDTSPLQWAQSILDSNPNTPTILSTHEYVQDNPAERSPAGEELWDQFVRTNDQVFMVLNGHFHAFGFPFGGQHHQVSMNDAGRPVIEVLQNYQNFNNGGDGWMRLINFNIPSNKLSFETYSPHLDSFLSTEVGQFGSAAGQFEFEVDFATRLVPIENPATIGDFDTDRDVDGDDFLLWQRGGSPTPYALADLRDWEEAYISSLDTQVGAVGVPEPSAVALFFTVLVSQVAGFTRHEVRRLDFSV